MQRVIFELQGWEKDMQGLHLLEILQQIPLTTHTHMHRHTHTHSHNNVIHYARISTDQRHRTNLHNSGKHFTNHTPHNQRLHQYTQHL